MANQKNKNFVDSVMDAQKTMVDTLVENTKKMTNGNTYLNDALKKGTDFYNDVFNKQKEAIDNVTKKTEKVSETAKESTTKANEYYQNWLNTQVNWAKQVWDMNQNFIKNNIPTQEKMKNTQATDWMNMWTNGMTNFNNWINQSNNMNQWWNNIQKMNPTHLTESYKEATENWAKMFNNYSELMNNTFADMQKNMQNTTTKDVYSNMMNAMTGFGKFNELWAPFWKSIQDKTFKAEDFKKYFNTEGYKEMMDNFFGFMPEGSRQYMQQATDMWNANMKNIAENGKTGYNNFREMYNNMSQVMGNYNIFENALGAYNNAQQMFQNAVSPIAKMVSPNQYTKSANDWADIANETAIYNIKNAQLQYMMYQQSTTVMDKLVENVMNKIENGVEINSMTALYQEWLSISDNVYVSLFESDAYSELMAEVSALQLKLRKSIDIQVEKSFANVPVATRSELDELYKVIYDLKKEVRQLEKMMEFDTEDKTTATKKTTKK